MDSRQLYDLHAAVAPTVASAKGTHEPRNVVLAAWAAEALAARVTDVPRLVEVGIGDGDLAFALADRMPRAKVLGVDIAPARTDAATRAAAAAGLDARVTFRALDVEREGPGALADASADAVFAIDVLEHVFDVFGFVGHLARVVRPGGLVVLRVPNIAYLRHRVALARGRLPVTASWFGPPGDLGAWRETWGWDGGHLHYFTRATLSALLEGAGLRVLAWRDPGARFEGARRALPSLLIGNLCAMAERVASPT